MFRKFSCLIALLYISFFYSQDYYTELRKKYWEYEENDTRAFLYLNLCIEKAKKEKDYIELYNAYKDAVRYSPNEKLLYADSAVAAAQLSENNDLIGNAHTGKGIIYYFNYRKYKLALDEYLKAVPYLENADDIFLKYQNMYHIGVVKSYLGYYSEALVVFKECIEYFEPLAKSKIHPNLLFNNQKGYLNALHQSIVCYQALGDYQNAKKLIDEGYKILPVDPEFSLEKSYLDKSSGINLYSQKKYDESIREFDNSLPALIKNNDFTWVSVVYFFRGRCYSNIRKSELAVEDYKKVDSIFNKYNFILPQIRNNYDELIDYYREHNNPERELYYTKQLLKVDSIISTDFKYLAPKIYKEYDTKKLLASKHELENENSVGKYLLLGSILVIIVLLGFIYYWFRRKKELQIKYTELLTKMKINEKELPIIDEISINQTSKLEAKIVKKLLSDLTNFEKNGAYLEKGVTLSKLAKEFETNTSYLSQVINEYKSNNFNTYLNSLRIHYATQKMYQDKLWRRYSIEDIAFACGFSNRQSFSNSFFEYNGIRPVDFLKKRKEELELQNVS